MEKAEGKPEKNVATVDGDALKPISACATEEETATEAKDVVFTPGPYHAVNTEKNREKKPLPGYLVSWTPLRLIFRDWGRLDLCRFNPVLVWIGW